MFDTSIAIFMCTFSLKFHTKLQIKIEVPIICFSLFDEIELQITENYVMTHAKGIVQMINKMHL